MSNVVTSGAAALTLTALPSLALAAVPAPTEPREQRHHQVSGPAMQRMPEMHMEVEAEMQRMHEMHCS